MPLNDLPHPPFQSQLQIFTSSSLVCLYFLMHLHNLLLLCLCCSTLSFSSYHPAGPFPSPGSPQRATICTSTSSRLHHHHPSSHTRSLISLQDDDVHPSHFYALCVVGVTPPVRGGRAAPASAAVSQPRPVPIQPAYLTDTSGLVSCPSCHQVVSSKIKYVPGTYAWGMCVCLALRG